MLCVASALILSSCLKTRSQLRADDDDVKPQVAQIQEVQPQGHVIDEIKTEITRLTGRLEDVERKGQAQDAAVGRERTEEVRKLETRIMELEKAQASMLEAIQKMAAAVPPPDTTELFEKGRNEYGGKQYEEAIESLSGYLKNPKGKFAEDATLMRGESYFETKQFKKAIIDFSKFPEKWTRSKHLASALLRIGQSFDALGMKEDARGFYQELAEKFPKSPEAKKIRTKLK